ncbi:MAG: isoleucine--tRNA ligase [Patescibacteria group bacterium]|nr:isoleucine--tRNA ligase [Patescibacteria group bacterium]
MPKVKSFRKTPDLPKLEEEVQKFWEENKIFEKSVEQRSADNSFVFYDGPPFATGLPHYGHILASTMKDVMPRFHSMLGKRVERVWGWDCHGLPLENLVEKELEIDAKTEIEELGVAKFNETCRTKVLRYRDEWKKIIRRLGRWVDMDNDYKTMDRSYMETVWWVFKQLWDQDLVYHGYKPMHICPRCGTPLSNFEVNLGYQEIKDLSVTVKFKLKSGQKLSYTANDDKEKELSTADVSVNLLVWTTTPWTLPGNCLLAVNPQEDYVLVKDDESDEYYVLGEKRLAAVIDVSEKCYQKLGRVKSASLLNKKYQPLFPYFKETKNAFHVAQADFVTTEDGTGLVHIAPGFGEDDFYLGQKENVELVQHVNAEGKFTAEVKEFVGLKVKPKGDPKQTDKKVVAWLEEKGSIFKQEVISHTYPYCWRCDTPLLNYATDSWFVNVTKFKDELVKNNKDINWVPDHMKEGRFGHWLEGVKDWAVSRNRYWGAPLPVWESEDGDRICLGSAEELEELSGEKVSDLHKHHVDEIVIKKDGKEYRRVSQVFDCWFESGSMPYAQHHYPFKDKEQFEHRFPADFIAEGEDQTRGWFYTLHVLATALSLKGKESSLPVEKCTSSFKNVVVTGIILARDGKKMSKRLKNYPDPVEVIDEFGADSLRLYLMQSPVVKGETLRFNKRKVSQMRRRVFLIWWNMISFYKLFANQDHDVQEKPEEVNNLLDQWLLSRLNSLTRDVTQAMKSYDLTKATRPLIEFVNEFSTWYLRLSRERLKADHNQQVSHVFGYTLYQLAKLYAPFTPFFAELVHHNLVDENSSIHLLDWPEADTELIDEELEHEMEVIEKVVEKGRGLRRDKQVKLRHPLASLEVSLTQPLQHQKEFENLVKNELNVKKVMWKQDLDELEVDYDFVLTVELKTEAKAKDLIRKIQDLRRKALLKINDQVVVELPDWPHEWQQEIESKTNTTLKKGEKLKLVA